MRCVSVVLCLSVALLSQPSHGAVPTRLTARDADVTTLLAKMTLEEKIGQMIQAEQDKLKDAKDIETYFLGSLLSGGDSDPKTNSIEDWREMYDRYQSHALRTRLAIPILYGVDAVHGHNNVIGATVFPHNIGLGATRNAKLVEDISRATALEVRATGIQWAFAPCVTVPRDDRWGRTYEGFAEEPSLVAELGAAAVRGLQGPDLSSPTSVLACAKHLAGDGGTTYGTGIVDPASKKQRPLDRGDTRLSEAELRRLHLQGYVTTLKEGVGSVMPSYNSWNGVKASASRRLMTEILKEEMGFEGFLISDYNAIDEISSDFRANVRASVNAGMDMFMVPERYREMFTTLKGLVDDGAVPLARIDDAVRRILRVKLAMGLMDPKRSHLADPKLRDTVGSPAHRALARQAVRESLVLLKNDNKALPLARDVKHLHVAGQAASDIGRQCGGWTITWQGGPGAITKGTTILEGIRKAVSPTTKITHAVDAEGATGADRAIVVVSEMPYAEYQGDREDLSLPAEDVATIARLSRDGIPTTVVLISGRPMLLGDSLQKIDALIAAWLPGTEGDGIADVLFGEYKPTGKLSFSWPRTAAQTVVNVGDAKYDPLFAFGFGLTYK